MQNISQNIGKQVLSKVRSIPGDTYRYLIVDAFVLFMLYSVGLSNYLLSHSLAEMLTIVIMVLIAAITWNAREYLNNNYLLFIGISLISVAALDLFHTLFYGGMGFSTATAETNVTSQLWIAARLVGAGSLMAAPLFIRKKLRIGLVMSAYAALTGVILLSIFSWGIFPTAYVDGVGQTMFKIGSEIVIAAALLASFVFLVRKRAFFKKSTFALLFAFILISAVSGIFIALYVNEHDFFNIAGHLLKIVAFYLLYRAVAMASFEDPHKLLLQNIQNRENELSLHAAELEELNRQLKKFQLAVEYASDHIIITDPEGMILYANKAVEKITGFAPREILGKKVGALWGKQMSMEFYRELWKTIKEKKKEFTGEIINRRRNGELYHSLATIFPIVDENRDIQFFVGIERDITKKKEYENRLQEYAEKMEEGKARDDALLLSIADGILVTDTAGKIVYVNSSLERICGMKVEELIGRDMYETIPFYDDMEKRAPREKIPLYIALNKEKQNELPISASTTFHVVNKKDRKKIPLSISGAPFIIDNKISGAVVVLRDITHEKEIDRAKVEFISFASHQLRTPLTSISLSIDTLLNHLKGAFSKEQKSYLKIAYGGVKDMADIIETLLNISRIQMGTLVVNPEPTDLAAFSDSILRNISISLKSRSIKIKKSYDKEVPRIKVDRHLMKIIFENLISNAMKYSQVKSTILVEIKRKGRNALIAVSDTGDGIPKGQQKKIFEKLFRVQSDGKVKGTGLGLYMVKAAVDQYGGRVWCESPSQRAFNGDDKSSEQKGTTFYVTVPLAGMGAKKS